MKGRERRVVRRPQLLLLPMQLLLARAEQLLLPCLHTTSQLIALRTCLHRLHRERNWSQSVALRGTQRHSEALRGTQRHSPAPREPLPHAACAAPRAPRLAPHRARLVTSPDEGGNRRSLDVIRAPSRACNETRTFGASADRFAPREAIASGGIRTASRRARRASPPATSTGLSPGR